MKKNKPIHEKISSSFSNLVSRAFSGNIENKLERLQKNENSGILFTKDKNTGQIRWFGIYSSNYLDDDFPADIISSEAHKGFIDRVEKGVVPYPELWHAHIKGSRWGVADWLAYDDETGIAYASGLVDIGREKEAFTLAGYKKGKLGLSHGMDRKSLRRDDPFDKRVITQYNSYEISDLPLRWAANGMTALSFSETANSGYKEDGMTISESKKQYLTDAGLSEEQISGLEALGEKQAEENAGRPRKEKPEEEEKEATEESTLEENSAKESETANGESGEENDTEKEGVEETETENDAEVEKEALTKDEVLKAVSSGIEEFAKAFADALEKIDSRVAQIENLEKQRAEKEKEQMLAPALSGILEKVRSIGAEEAEVKDGDPLFEDGPKETPFNKESVTSGRDFVANTIGSLFSK